jgi:hypothetical protein
MGGNYIQTALQCESPDLSQDDVSYRTVIESISN